MNDALKARIVVDPEVRQGRPVIRGTRIPVEQIVRMLAEQLSYEEILREYPRLTREDIQAALFYASEVLTNEEVFPLAKAEGEG